MSEPDRPQRVYGEEEVGRILQRATELQHREPKPTTPGLTLAELEEVAAEAGIDPVHLRRAAMEVEAGTDATGVWSHVVGETLKITRDISLPGELDQSGFEWVAAAIQDAATEHGQPSLLGRTLTWRAETASKTRTTQIVVSSRGGQTSVRLEENLAQIASGLFGGLTVGGGVGVGVGVGLPLALEVLGSTLFAVAAPLGMMSLGYVAARAAYRIVVKRRRDAVDALFDRVVREAQAAIDEGEAGLDELPTEDSDPGPRALSDGSPDTP
ncbi:MAG: hypothetical protein R3304_10890 [Longimicrobiales bacterium]|nr:hypothetical protein [Longimicrobiales bacterium]